MVSMYHIRLNVVQELFFPLAEPVLVTSSPVGPILDMISAFRCSAVACHAVKVAVVGFFSGAKPPFAGDARGSKWVSGVGRLVLAIPWCDHSTHRFLFKSWSCFCLHIATFQFVG